MAHTEVFSVPDECARQMFSGLLHQVESEVGLTEGPRKPGSDGRLVLETRPVGTRRTIQRFDRPHVAAIAARMHGGEEVHQIASHGRGALGLGSRVLLFDLGNAFGTLGPHESHRGPHHANQQRAEGRSNDTKTATR